MRSFMLEILTKVAFIGFIGHVLSHPKGVNLAVRMVQHRKTGLQCNSYSRFTTTILNDIISTIYISSSIAWL